MPNEFNQQIIDEFRANEGRVGGMFEGSPLVLLTTTGARSGKPVTTPVMYLEDGDRYVVIASNAGADNHPAWYHNLRATPSAAVEVGTETFEAKAVFIEGRSATGSTPGWWRRRRVSPSMRPRPAAASP